RCPQEGSGWRSPAGPGADGLRPAMNQASHRSLPQTERFLTMDRMVRVPGSPIDNKTFDTFAESS
ncbi:MAG: hypothetical protein JW829_12785, partial [Pirellulales bacterium]|nr:hypothetical protein [Pirellulales bacterium]